MRKRVLFGIVLLMLGTQSYATVLARDDFPDTVVQDEFNGTEIILAYDDFGNAYDEFTDHAGGFIEHYSHQLPNISGGNVLIPSGEWIKKKYSFGKNNANKHVQIKFSATLAGGWESSDYLNFYVNGSNPYYGNGTGDTTVPGSVDSKLDNNGDITVWISPRTNEASEIAEIDYVRIDLESTDAYTAYYGNKPDVESQNGQLVIASKQWTRKTYDFGSDYANQDVRIEFSADLTHKWEKNSDYFIFYANGGHNFYSDGSNSLTVNGSINTSLDSNGKVTVWMSPRTNSSNEVAKVNHVKISKISKDGYRGYYNPESLSVSGGKLLVPSGEWANKTYSFGKSNANACINIDFSALLTGAWESSGDYLNFYVNGSNFYYANGTGDTTVSGSIHSKLDNNGDITVWISPRTNEASEIAEVDYVKLTIGNPEGYVGYSNPESICVANSRIIVPQKEWIHKTYDLGSSYANQDVTVDFSADLTGGWDATNDYLYTWSSGTYNKFYATGGNSSKDVQIHGFYTGTVDASGKLQVWMSPQTSSTAKIAKIDYIEIRDSTNIDADLKVIEHAVPTPSAVYKNQDVNFYVRATNDGPDASEKNVVLKISYNQNVTVVSAEQIAGGSNFVCDKTSGFLRKGKFITCTRDTDFSSSSSAQDFQFTVQPRKKGTLVQTTTIAGKTTNDPDQSNNTIASTAVTVTKFKTTCPGEVLPTLDGTTVSALDQYTGEVIDGREVLYYSFTPKVEGKFDLIFDADADYNKADITLLDACGGNELASDTTTVGDKTVSLREVNANQQVIIKIYRDHANPMTYGADFNFTKIIPTPPNMLDVPNLIYRYGDAVTQELETYAQTTNSDPITQYVLTGALPAGLTFDSSTGVISGNALDSGVFPLSIQVRDKDGLSNSDDFTIEVTIDIVENADDLCYANPPIYSGMMCMDMGMCKGGMNCKTTYTLKNDSQSDLSSVVVDYDETGMGGTFGSKCGVSPAGQCESKSNINMGLAGMLGKATEFSLDYAIPPGSDQSSIWTQAMFSGSCFNGSNLYGTYIKAGKLYRGKLKECATIVTPVTNTEWKNGLGDFYLVNPSETRNIVGNYAVAGNTSTCLVNKTSGYGYKSDGTPMDCLGQTGEELLTSNMRVNRYIDIDEDSRTWNSTSSYVDLPEATYDPDRGILWAGLFWQGRVVDETEYDMRYGIETTAGYKYIETGKHQSNYHLDVEAAQVNRIKLKIDEGSYNDVTANKVYKYNSSHGTTYAAFANVTSKLQAGRLEKGKHTFTIANLTTNEGRESSPGLFGGWSLVVIYGEDLNLGRPRNVSIYNGFKSVSAKPIISIKGFKLPKKGDVTSQLTVFSGEGEYRYGYRQGSSSQDWMKISKDKYSNYQYMPGKSAGREVGNRLNMFDAVMDGVERDDVHDADNKRLYNALPINNNGVDIDNYDVSSIMEAYRDSNKDINEVFIKLYSNNDYVTTSMVSYSAELYIPKLCYDYTLDIDGYALISQDNNVTTPFGSFGSQLRTTTFIKSLEGDISFRDVYVSYDINDTAQLQYTYQNCSTEILEEGDRDYSDGCPYTYNETRKGFSMNIGEGKGATVGKGGSMQPEESRYMSWLSDFKTSSVQTRFDFAIDYTVDYGAGAVPIHQEFTSADLCPPENSGFLPQLGYFNITDAANPYDKYNLYTQVTRRPFKLKAYMFDINDFTQLVDGSDLNLTLGVEMIRADNFSRDANTACGNPKSTIAEVPMKFAYFNGKADAMVEYGAEDINISAKSAAMRMWYFVNPNDETQVLNIACNNQDWDGQRACEQMYDDYFKPEHLHQECNYACNRGQSWGVGVSCYDCLRPKAAKSVCSRDNFAIRPEAFTVSILDSNQSQDITKESITLNINNDIHYKGKEAQGVAGYKYRFDINATSHTCREVSGAFGSIQKICDEPVVGYVQNFEPGNQYHRALMSWDPRSISESDAASNCVDAEDKNITINLFNGTNVNYQTNTSYLDKVQQIGEYRFELYDKEWTSADWSDAEMPHHSSSAYSQYYYQGDDCSNIDGDPIAPYSTETGVDSGVVPASSSNDKVGCGIRSKHTNTDEGKEYNALDMQFHPYQFDLTDVTAEARHGGFGDFVYINTLDEFTDGNMSYNIHGVVKATGKDNVVTTNFVDRCFAEPVNLDLYQKYNHEKPNDEPYIHWNVAAYDANGDTINGSKENTTYATLSQMTTDEPISVKRDTLNFAKDMEGTMNIDLSYNFDRDYNKTLEPRQIHMDDFNVTYETQPIGLVVDLSTEHDIEGSKDINRDISFQYARAKSSLLYYDNVVEDNKDTPISIVSYCSLGPITCNTRGINTDPGRGLTDEYDWYKSVDHNTTNQDGDMYLVPTADVADGAVINNSENANIIITNNGINETVNVKAVKNDRPMEVKIGFDTTKTDPWIIYNPDDNSIPDTLYKVRFVDDLGAVWAGHGDTGNVVKGKVNEHKNNRLGW